MGSAVSSPPCLTVPHRQAILGGAGVVISIMPFTNSVTYGDQKLTTGTSVKVP